MAENDFFDRLSDGHDLINANPALVATVAAVLAPFGLIRRPAAIQIGLAIACFKQGLARQGYGHLAPTQAARQSLRGNEIDCRGNIEGRYAHVEQPCQCGRRIVGMQGGENHVSGLGGFDGDVGGVEVPYFADQDDVRVLSQKGF